MIDGFKHDTLPYRLASPLAEVGGFAFWLPLRASSSTTPRQTEDGGEQDLLRPFSHRTFCRMYQLAFLTEMSQSFLLRTMIPLMLGLLIR